MKQILLISILAIVVSGCGINEGRTVTVYRETMDQEWPLTIERGYLTCQCVDRGFLFWCVKGAVTIHDPEERVTYSVNDVYVPRYVRGADIEVIRRSDPNMPSSKVDLGPLIERGLDLC